jgi:hypothetical protein
MIMNQGKEGGVTWLEERKNMRRQAMKLYWARVKQKPTAQKSSPTCIKRGS